MTMLSKLHRILLGAALAVGSATAFTGVARAADADLQLTLIPPKVTPPATVSVIHYDETLDYTATVTNLGPGLASGAKITAVTLPAGFEVAGITNCKPDDVAGKILVPCTLQSGTLPAGEIIPELDPLHPEHQVAAVITVSLPAPMTADDPPKPNLPTVCPDLSPLSLEVTIGSASDPVPGNDTVNSADVTNGNFTIGTFADLSVEMTAPAKAGYGSDIAVLVTVKNLGPCAATNVNVDDLDNSNGFISTNTLEFLSATGDCTEDPRAGTCVFDSIAVGDIPKTWTLNFKVTGYPSSLTSSTNPVGMYVRSLADDAFDPNADNDIAVTHTVASRSQSGCSTGDMGGALSLLALGLPFLRRRRKS